MKPGLRAGAAAGVIGTLALNAATYVDMTMRARPASGLPAEAAGLQAKRAGVHLGQGEEAENRKSGLGALMGYATGVAVGALYGLLVRRRPARGLRHGMLLALVAMGGANGPLVAMGLADPRKWGASDWLSDLGPHLAYGWATASAYRSVTR
jgi:hypothetical protein